MSLCDRCTSSTRFTRRNNRSSYYCDNLSTSREVPGDIESCSSFSDKAKTGLRSMETIAWMLRTDKSGTILGFRPPKKEDDDDTVTRRWKYVPD